MKDETVGQLWKLIVPGYRNIRGTASYERYWLIRKLVIERAAGHIKGNSIATSRPFQESVDLACRYYGIDPASWALAERVTGDLFDGEQS